MDFISDPKKRNKFYLNKKDLIFKKAYELTKLTKAEILVLILNEDYEVHTFASGMFGSFIRNQRSKILEKLSDLSEKHQYEISNNSSEWEDNKGSHSLCNFSGLTLLSREHGYVYETPDSSPRTRSERAKQLKKKQEEELHSKKLVKFEFEESFTDRKMKSMLYPLKRIKKEKGIEIKKGLYAPFNINSQLQKYDKLFPVERLDSYPVEEGEEVMKKINEFFFKPFHFPPQVIPCIPVPV